MQKIIWCLFLPLFIQGQSAFTIHPDRSPKTTLTMDFESTADFSLAFSPWTTLDKDTSATFGIAGYTFPHSEQPFAFISFNPAQVSPPMTDADIQPHSGSRFGACFADTSGPNNDWFISPRILLDSNESFSFWVKSYTGYYGLEKYKVGISTTDTNPASFTFISGTLPLTADTFWTKKTFSLSAYKNQQVYVAIQCVSDNAFIFMIDDLEISATSSYPSFMSLDFENLADFTLDFTPWAVADVNGGGTYFIQDHTFPNDKDPFAYIVFNPSQDVPAMTDSGIQPHAGQRFGACFSSPPPYAPNNKWLISPKMHLGNNPQIGLWVRTYNVLYGYEKYNIAVSVATNNPNDFTVISGPLPLEAPADWAYRQFNLSDYTNRDAYVGIQCVSNDQFIFMVDDIQIGSSLGIEDIAAERITIYPNPARDKIFITFGGRPVLNPKVILFNSMGTVIGHPEFKGIVQGTVEYRLPALANGIYLISVNDEMGTIVKKFIIEK
jgi:hypothetical protein